MERLETASAGVLYNSYSEKKCKNYQKTPILLSIFEFGVEDNDDGCCGIVDRQTCDKSQFQ